MSKDKKKQTVKITVFISSIFVIFLSISYAFINQTLVGIKRQLVTAGNLQIELEEEQELILENAMPIYDETGMLQDSFDFRLVNYGKQGASYVVKLVDITTDEKLDTSIVKYGLTKEEQNRIDYLSSIEDSVVDVGFIKENQIIHYSLRLWIDSSVEDEGLIKDKSLKYRIEVELSNAEEIELDLAGGTAEETKSYIVHDQYTSLPTPTKEGYNFLGWYDEEDNLIVEGTVPQNRNSKLIAKWAIVTYTITFNPNGGVVNPITKQVEHRGTYGSLPTPSKTNYIFLGWQNESSNLVTSSTKVLNKNEQLTASWKEKEFLYKMKQGDYVAYVGSNGCQNNGTDITGTSDAESNNSCLGWNANQSTTDTEKFGYCYDSRYKYTVTGWRIAYTGDNRAYLISAGSPECNKRPTSLGNAPYITLANEKAKKYCNSNFVDGNCSDNSDSWGISNTDFYKITESISGTGQHVSMVYGTPHCNSKISTSCGQGNDLLDNGGYYWFATASPYGSSDNFASYWYPASHQLNSSGVTDAYGLRPVIRLSSSVYVTGGSGTINDPYTIAND